MIKKEYLILFYPTSKKDQTAKKKLLKAMINII